MADHPTPSNVKVKERIELYLFSPLGLENISCQTVMNVFYVFVLHM